MSLISLIIILGSCQTNSIVDVPSLKPKPALEDIYLLDLIHSFDIVPLKQHADGQLDYLKTLRVYDDQFFMSYSPNNAIFVFDKNGEFYSKIKGVGDGPLEYGSQAAFDIYDGKLYVGDNENHKCVIFNCQNLKPLDEIKLQSAPFGVCATENQITFLVQGDGNGNIRRYNHSKQLEASCISEPSSFNLISSIRPFYFDGKEVFLSASFSDTIYSIRDNSVIPLLAIGEGSANLHYVNNHELVEAVMTRQMTDKMQNIIIPYGSISVVNHVMLINTLFPKGTIMVDRASLQSTHYRSTDIRDMNIFCPGVFLNVLTQHEGYHYTSTLLDEKFYNAMQHVIDNKQGPHVDKLRAFLKEYPKSINFQNPVIFKLKFKSNLASLIHI